MPDGGAVAVNGDGGPWRWSVPAARAALWRPHVWVLAAAVSVVMPAVVFGVLAPLAGRPAFVELATALVYVGAALGVLSLVALCLDWLEILPRWRPAMAIVTSAGLRDELARYRRRYYLLCAALYIGTLVTVFQLSGDTATFYVLIFLSTVSAMVGGLAVSAHMQVFLHDRRMSLRYGDALAGTLPENRLRPDHVLMALAD